MLLAIISINTKSKIDKCLLFFIQFRVFLSPFFTPVELLGLAFYSLIKKLNSSQKYFFLRGTNLIFTPKPLRKNEYNYKYIVVSVKMPSTSFLGKN